MEKLPGQGPWSPVARLAAGSIRGRRDELGWALSRLAERLTQIGYPLSVKLLSRIERGERNITVDDLSALSHALMTPVDELLMPNEEREARIRRQERAAFYWLLRTVSRYEAELERLTEDHRVTSEKLAHERNELQRALECHPTWQQMVDEWEREQAAKGAWFDGGGPRDEEDET